VVCIILPLALVSMLGYAVMAMLDIGMKVATLPVVSLAVGIGVDYGIYIYAALRKATKNTDCRSRGLPAGVYEHRASGTLHRITLAVGVATWLWSDLKFQADMGSCWCSSSAGACWLDAPDANAGLLLHAAAVAAGKRGERSRLNRAWSAGSLMVHLCCTRSPYVAATSSTKRRNVSTCAARVSAPRRTTRIWF